MASIETLMVGGPCNRSWMYQQWLDYLLAACRNTDLVPEVVHSVPAHDQELQQEILSYCSTRGVAVDLIPVKEPQRVDRRVWNLERFGHMVELRNRVLQVVRDTEPSYFWSLDSDILPQFDALSKALEHMDRFDAVGMRCYMAPNGREFPSYGMLRNDRLINRRDTEDGCFPVDCVMASKLMSPAAYEIDYQVGQDGEDIGWSMACTAVGLKLGWNATSVAKHVMAPELLDRVDPRIGW